MAGESYRIALVGGTGEQGPPLAVRWASKGHRVYIGSRRREKAERVAGELMGKMRTLGLRGELKHGVNQDVVREAEVVVLTIPYGALKPTLEALRDHIPKDAVVVNPVVPMEWKGKLCIPVHVEEGSAGELIAKSWPEVRVVTAFQTVSAARLADYTKPVEGDVLICGDDEEAKRVVAKLVEDIPNLRPVDCGPLLYSAAIEHIVPLLIQAGRKLKKHDLGVKLV